MSPMGYRLNDLARSESQPGSCSSLTHSLGIMVPVLDMFNHCHDSEVDWFSDESGVMCMRGDDPDDEDIPTGSEIFSNYGPKSNEMLLLLHGFAKFNNPNDTYALSIDVRFSDDPEDNGEIVIPNDDGGNNGNNVVRVYSAPKLLRWFWRRYCLKSTPWTAVPGITGIPGSVSLAELGAPRRARGVRCRIYRAVAPPMQCCRIGRSYALCCCLAADIRNEFQMICG
eukprot:INCI17555.3.p2 GENE.INCI17555.3~~INCI17555.3.p2  ORF type:complete len:226 (+),score=27.53 INCI17555.3:32-709(+)